MSSVNKAILMGRLGKDPEVRAIPSGIKVANFSIATSEKYTDGQGNKVEKTEWHNCQAWRGLADVIEKYVKKGDLIYIEGKITTRSYEKDGITRYATEIVVNEMKLMPNAKRDGASGGDGFGSQPSGGSNTPPPPEDDLPF